MTATGYVSTNGDGRKVNKAGDTMTGDLVLADASPDTPNSAAPKAYVDALAALFAALTGATFTGDVTINGANLVVKRTDGTGAYRFRVTGGGLDLDIAGLDVFVSKFANGNFTGTQSNVLRLEGAGPHLIGRTQFGTTPFDDVHDIDSGTGVASLGAKNGLSNIRLCGRRTSTGAPTSGTWATGDAVQDSAGAWWLCTAGGTPGTWATSPGSVDSVPADAGLVSWSLPPWAASSAGPGNGGFVYYMRVKVPVATTVTGVRLYQTAAGSTLTSGQCLVGLYDASGNRVAISADQSTAWASGSQINKDSAFTGQYNAAAGYYWIAVLFNGTTGPSWPKGAPSGTANAGWPAAPFPALISGSGQTSLPASVAFGSLSTSVSAFWTSLY
ncbi:hypothetical protein [Streptomyces sp. NPDC001221]